MFQANNPNVMTGKGYCFGLRDGFYSSDAIGHIDAPICTVAGSTVENIIKGSGWKDMDGRYVIQSLVYRG